MKSNKQQCKKSLLPLSEEFNTQSRIADELSDELTEESTIFQQSTQFFSDCSEFDSKQQIVIKQAEYNTNEQLFKQKQQDNNLQNSYESIKEYIQKYKPKNIILDSKLKPFIPEYIPAVNTIENGISIPRPDGKFDKYGIYDVVGYQLIEREKYYQAQK
ncbi:unnamed protein product [Paramecium primaurelia]|uniref:Uncharacterized protein n=1 Tax=Paramecium primaurelia TaxID=5886 RepID=A0A8S1NK10_PARPR|nr:unnamed protein product [Paramecium primaurelia]